MKKLILLLLAAVMALGCAACAAKPYTPAGQATGNAELDEAVLALLQELCDPKADLVANLGTVNRLWSVRTQERALHDLCFAAHAP